MKELESKSCEADDKLSELNTITETIRINLHLANGRTKTCSEKIKEVEEIVANLKQSSHEAIEIPAGGDVDVKQL